MCLNGHNDEWHYHLTQPSDTEEPLKTRLLNMIKKNIPTVLAMLILSLYIVNKIIHDIHPSRAECNCARPLPPRGEDFSGSLAQGVIPPDGSFVGSSYCNYYTDMLGSGQNVISYSYYTPASLSSGTPGKHWFR